MRGGWTVYIVRCRTGELYTGSTNDVDRRVGQHNAGIGSKFTRSRRPVVLVYEEACGSQSAALRREVQIKSMRRKEKLALVQSASATTA